MSDIIDYKIIVSDFTSNLFHTGNPELTKNINDFIEKVTIHLKEGYTLLGTTLFNDEPSNWIVERHHYGLWWPLHISQTVVKYSTPPPDKITEYTILHSSLNLHGYRSSNIPAKEESVKKLQSSSVSILTGHVKDAIKNGWTLHEGIRYNKLYSHAVLYTQVLIKKQKQTEIPYTNSLEN